MPLHRRAFLSSGLVSGIAIGAESFAAEPSPSTPNSSESNSTIFLTGDGLSLTPREFAAKLDEVTRNASIEEDHYARHGIVEIVENAFANELGKERAIYLPTGTMANHLAMRILIGSDHRGQRAIVPAECHLYNDSGDCAQQLSGINLIPLAPGSACFSLKALKQTMSQFQTNRVATPVRALLIESPVRRRDGECVPFEEMKSITQFAKENDVKTHLDGARLYIASAYTGVSPKQYASLFDTVFVSLNKYFNAGSGAILAGSKEMIDGLYHTRRMLGGSLSQAWPFAAMAVSYREGFIDRLKRAIATSEKLIANLDASKKVTVRRIPNGTNIFAVTPKGIDAKQFQSKLAKNNIIAYDADAKSGEFLMRVNETLNRSSAESLTEVFLEAASR